MLDFLEVFFDTKNLKRIALLAVVIICVFLGWSFTNTYRSIHQEQNLSVNQVYGGAISDMHAHVQAHVVNDYHSNKRNSYVEHHYHAINSTQTYDKKLQKLHQVLVFDNSHYDKHGIKHILYNRKENRIRIVASHHNAYVENVDKLINHQTK